MGDFKVHNVRFFNYQPQAIHCLAYEKQSKKIAVSRSDNSIEVWNLTYNPYQERVILGISSRSVEALVWCKGRLFSTGLHGDLTEYDLLKQKVKSSVQASHGSCWCMALNNDTSFLAVGTEQGYITLFSVNDYGIEFEKSLEKQEGRILCVSWHKSGEFIAAGSIDAIRIWNVQSGYAIQRILIGRTETRKETIVWCISFTEDFQIISGDSRGYVSFWNGKMGTQIDSFKSHQADVLALCIDENEEMVCAAGIDPRIVTFERISIRDDQKRNWTKTMTRAPHTHDVRAVVFADHLLVSGGVDTYLSLLRISSNIRLLCSPMPQYPCIHIATGSNSLLLQYKNILELWRLGTTSESSDSPRQTLQLSSNLLKLIELHSKDDEPIVCSCISRNADWLAYSTEKQIRLFCVIMEEEECPLPQVSLLKVRYIPPACLPGHRMVFTPDATKLIIAADDGILQIIGVDNIQPTLLHTFISPSEDADSIHLLSVTNDGKFLAAADHSSNIHVYNLDDYVIHCSLPVYRCQPSSMAFHPKTADLVVVYTDQKIVEYSLKSKRYTNWCRKISTEAVKSWMSRKYPTLGITFDPRNKNVIILNDDNLICVIHKEEMGLKAATTETERHSQAKKSRQQLENEGPDGFHYCHKYKHLVWFGRLTDDVVVAVEVNELALLQSLPPTLRLKKFGT